MTPRVPAPATILRRVLHALLGATVALPYAGAAWILIDTGRTAGPVVALALAVPVVLIGLAITLLPAVRELLIAAARTLLDADLPAPVPGAGTGSRLRAAGWLVVCVLFGLVAVSAVLWLLPTAFALLAAPWATFPPLPTGFGAWWSPPLGLVALVGAVVVPATAGIGQARLVGRFLGPSEDERLLARLAAADRLAARHAERARLARELHDSVGHALSVTTLQAGAAAELLDRDPEFARRALTAIADAGRAALEDLDHVLGLLNSDDDGVRAPVRDLAAVDTLLDGVRATGREVHAGIDPAPAVPAAVSREIYRLAQEALTNAVRYAGPGPLHLRLRQGDAAVELVVTSPLPTGGRRRATRGGRGLAGAADRVDLLGGTLSAGPDGGNWVLRAALPAPLPARLPGDEPGGR